MLNILFEFFFIILFFLGFNKMIIVNLIYLFHKRKIYSIWDK
jgi:hypothetical protein